MHFPADLTGFMNLAANLRHLSERVGQPLVIPHLFGFLVPLVGPPAPARPEVREEWRGLGGAGNIDRLP